LAVPSDQLRTAAITGAAARLTAAAIPLFAVGGVIGAAAGGGGGAAAGLAAAAVLVAGAAAYCDRIALSAMAARPVSEVTHPELYRLVRELSKEGRLPVPRLYLSPAGQPNAFTVGRHPRSAAICCTSGLLAGLDEAELRGVLGHELAHVSGRDILPGTISAALATIITCPAALARFRPARIRPSRVAGSGSAAARGGPGPGLGLLERALLLLFGPVAALVIRLSVSREGEYRADAAGALLSGDPVALATALRKIEAGAADLALVPGARVTAVAHLMMASPFRPEGFGLLHATHPPAGERLRRLEALAGYRR
jgi:heat shock protein HtpX